MVTALNAQPFPASLIQAHSLSLKNDTNQNSVVLNICGRFEPSLLAGQCFDLGSDLGSDLVISDRVWEEIPMKVHRSSICARHTFIQYRTLYGAPYSL